MFESFNLNLLLSFGVLALCVAGAAIVVMLLNQSARIAGLAHENDRLREGCTFYAGGRIWKPGAGQRHSLAFRDRGSVARAALLGDDVAAVIRELHAAEESATAAWEDAKARAEAERGRDAAGILAGALGEAPGLTITGDAGVSPLAGFLAEADESPGSTFTAVTGDELAPVASGFLAEHAAQTYAQAVEANRAMVIDSLGLPTGMLGQSAQPVADAAERTEVANG